MPQKSSGRKLTSSNALQFHQVINARLQRSKAPANDQRVLILSTPIKLKDGTVNIEQRAIPLRINNNQLMMTGTAKNNIISLKRNNEPPPLALPINQLNKKSPTFVKNEVGQVMGKLIPLGKFSNITPNSLRPITPVSTSSMLSNKNFKCDIAKQSIKPKETKTFKLTENARRNTNVINESSSLKQSQKNKAKSIHGTALNSASNGQGTTSIIPSLIGSKANTVNKHLTTVTTSVPKKQVHLVLKGVNNMASIGQTGTNIKLIPLEQWKMGTKLNLLKTMGSTSLQSKMMTTRKYMRYDGPGKDDAPYFDESKLQCSIKEEDFNMNDILEKDPLNIEELPIEENAIKSEPEQKCEINIKQEAKVMTEAMDTLSDYTVSKCIKESKPSDLVAVANGCKAVRLKVNNKYDIDSHWLKEKTTLPKKENHNDSSKGDTSNIWSMDREACNTKEAVEGKSIIQKLEPYDELCEHFNIKKSEVTKKELAMISYIQNLRRKLSFCQSSKVRMMRSLEQRRHRGMAYLTGIQRCFIKSQLRNSGKTPKKQRFTKLDISVAQEILKATGPRGYNNLRKLFHLPNRSITANT